MFKKNISKLLLIITVFIFVFVATVFIFENVKVKADTGFTSVTVNGDQTEQGSRS